MNVLINKLRTLLADHDSYKLNYKVADAIKGLMQKHEHNVTIVADELLRQSYVRTLSSNTIGDYSNYEVFAYVHDDYYKWVDYFICLSDDDYLIGSFSDVLYSSSEEFYINFTANHKYNEWDIGDI